MLDCVTTGEEKVIRTKVRTALESGGWGEEGFVGEVADASDEAEGGFLLAMGGEIENEACLTLTEADIQSTSDLVGIDAVGRFLSTRLPLRAVPDGSPTLFIPHRG